MVPVSERIDSPQVKGKKVSFSRTAGNTPTATIGNDA